MKKIICFLFGHRPTAGLFEDKEIISNLGCKRCGSALMTFNSIWKGLRAIVPPWTTREEYHRLCDEMDEEKRKEFSALK